MAKSTGSRIFVWAILAMIIVGLIGFGSTNIGGNIRSIGSVGDKEVPVSTYARALQQELAALQAQTGQQVTFAQAQMFGIDQQVLARVVSTTLLDAELSRIGISAGDEALREQLLQISRFQGIDGKFDRQTYTFALENSGLNEREFEQQLRDELARGLMQAAILGGTASNDAYAETFVNFLGETRDITWAELTMADLAAEAPVLTADDIRAYYDENIEVYSLPETRQITYAWLTPEMIIDTVELDEQSLRDAYDRRADEFNTPERRLVERLIYSNDAEATAALARVTDGTANFEDLVNERGLELIDVDLGDVTKSELGAAGDMVFAGSDLTVVGPAETSLGPALFRVNAILAAQSISFEDAQPMLREELAYDRSARVIDAQITDLEDLLAAGATLEELAQDTEMQLGQIGYHSAVADEIAGYASFRELAQTVTADDFPEIGNLADGGVFALRLDGVDPARPEDFDAIKDRVSEGLMYAKRIEQLIEQAEELKADFDTAELTQTVETGLGRNSRVGGAPVTLTAEVFNLDTVGQTEIYSTGSSVILYRLDAITAPDMASDESTALVQAINQQIEASLDQEIFESFANALRLRTEIELDQQAINAVHANFQ